MVLVLEIWQTQGFENERCVPWEKVLSGSQRSLSCSMCCTAQKPSRRLPHSTFLDLTTQTSAPDDAWEEEITGWDTRNTRDQSSGSSFWPQQPDVTSRLGPDLVPPSRLVRAADEMSVQEQETSHVPLPQPSASESAPPDVLVASVEPENSPHTVSTRRIMIWRRCLKF